MNENEFLSQLNKIADLNNSLARDKFEKELEAKIKDGTDLDKIGKQIGIYRSAKENEYCYKVKLLGVWNIL